MKPAMIHKFEVGQAIVPASPAGPSRNSYVFVKQLLPTSYEPQYWIQGMSSGVDCIVCET